MVGILDRFALPSIDGIQQQREPRRAIARGTGAHAFEIGPVERDDVTEAAEILMRDLARGLRGNIDPVEARDRNRARIGRVANMVGGGAGGIDAAFEPAAQCCRAERTFGHR